MHSPNRFLQYMLKPLLLLGLLGLSNLGFTQNTAPADAASSSAVSSAPAEKPLYTDSVERDNDLIAKAFTAIAKADELQWLEPPGEKVLTLYKTGETRKTKGVLLIMHAPETPQLWPTNLENLRRNLPIFGWGTMALPLPAKYQAVIPKRDVASSAPADAAATSSAPAASPAVNESSAVASSEEAKPLVERDKLIAGRVDAAVAQLNKLGQFNLVVLVDNSSAPDALAALYAKINKATSNSETMDGPLQALILVNLQDQEPLSRAQLSAIFSVGDLPVMDVFFNPDTKAQAELRRLHHAEAMRQNVKDYQQLVLPVQPSVSRDDTQNFWLGKIHGFVAAKAEGDEFANKAKTKSKPVEMK